jgi:hypothetical protein
LFFTCEELGLSRQGHGVKVFEKKYMRRIFGSRKEEVREGWRKLHSEELQVYAYH